MLTPDFPDNDAKRLESLRRMLLLDTPDEEVFDRITRIAHHLFQVPIALVSLVDLNRQWFKSCVGLSVRETGRDISFCGHAILGDELFIIDDASKDPRFADNPLVTAGPGIRFYAGKPLRNPEGYNIGTLCIIDDKPRQLDNVQRQMLNDLGIWAETVLKLRQLSESQKTLLLQLDAVKRKEQIDPLLQVWNRQGITTLLEQELQNRPQAGKALAIASVSLDQFKSLEQVYGLDFANNALKLVATKLRSSIGEKGVIGRMGDDQLLLILPDGIDSSTGAYGDALRRSIATIDPVSSGAGGEAIHFSVSIGLVSLGPAAPAINLPDLLSALQQAHYQAKRAGGNQAYSHSF